MNYVAWISIVLGVMAGGSFYIGRRLIRPARLSRKSKFWAWIALGTLFLLPMASSLLIRTGKSINDPLTWVAYTGLGFLSFVITFLFIRDVIWLFWWVGEKVVVLVQKAFARKPAEPASPSRRQFLLQSTNVGVIATAAVLTSYGVYEARRKPGIVDCEIPIAGLPAGFAGFRIVQITDVHAGLTVKRDWIETVVAEVENLKPDLIAFTGDLADGTVPGLRDDVSPFGELQAPQGKFFITGNHEYYSGALPWVEEARRLGFDVLLNEHRIIQRNGSAVALAGVTDYSGGQFIASHKSDPVASIAGAPQGMTKILLAHQPRTLYAAAPLGFHLMISGHTHGGQFFPWNLLATLGQPYIAGLHNHNSTWVYVSKGTGYWGPPVRLGARSEITVFTLRLQDYPPT